MTLVLLVVVPFAAALVFLLAGDRLGRRLTGALGTAALGFAFGIAVAIGQAFVAGKTFLFAEIGSWLPLRGADLSLRIEPAAVPLVLTITGIGALLGLAALSERRMAPGVGRMFFALETLIGGALLVVISRDLIFLLAGWGAVGLSSSLLLGHARLTAEGAMAGARSFVFARMSDVALLIAAFAMLALFRTVDIAEIAGRIATITPTPATGNALLAASLLVVAAVLVRTAQLPVHDWLVGRSRTPAAAAAAVHAIVMLSGAAILIRLGGALSAPALGAAAIIGAITVVVAMACALASGIGRRSESWMTVAQLGAVVVVCAAGSSFDASLVVIASASARAAAALAAEDGTGPQRRIARALAATASLATLITAGLLLGHDRAPFALAVLLAAVFASAHLGRVVGHGERDDATAAAGMSAPGDTRADRVGALARWLAGALLAAASLVVIPLALSGGLSLGAPASSVTPGTVGLIALIAVAVAFAIAVRGVTVPQRAPRWMRVDRASELIYDRGLLASVRLIAAILDRGAEASIDRGSELFGIVLLRTSARVRGIGAVSAWRHEAIFVAAAVAIALYWTLR